MDEYYPRRSKRVRTLTKEAQSSTDSKPELSTNPLYTIGLIADIQYAPIPDGYSYAGIPRYYRNSLKTARHAALHFAKAKVDLVINLGDIVDGKCQAIAAHGGDPLPPGTDPGHSAVEDVLQALSAYKGPVLHAYGNHCLYNLDRPAMQKKLGIPFVKEPCGDLVGYSSYVHKGIRYITLDSYDVALLQRCATTSPKHQEAVDTLKRNNPNFLENPKRENSPEGLVGVAKRFVAFNGAVGKVQLAWLRKTLEESRANGERAIILSHQPILPGSSSPVCLMWNYKEVLEVLRDYADVVIASFAGHAHKGGYKRDRTGIHFRVFEAALENMEQTYATIEVHNDHLAVHGYGNCRSAVYKFDHQPATIENLGMQC